MKKLKETLNLPSTGFSMKANLAQKEPEILIEAPPAPPPATPPAP